MGFSPCGLSTWVNSTTDLTFTDLSLQLLTRPELNQLPTFHEVHTAVKGLKNNKAARPDGLNAQVLKFDCYHFFTISLSERDLLVEFHSSGRIPISRLSTRGKETRHCDNGRDISLLSVTGKVLASQCRFRRGHSIIDIFFVANPLQEKCQAHHKLFLTFTDLTKAFWHCQQKIPM